MAEAGKIEKKLEEMLEERLDTVKGFGPASESYEIAWKEVERIQKALNEERKNRREESKLDLEWAQEENRVEQEEKKVLKVQKESKKDAMLDVLKIVLPSIFGCVQIGGIIWAEGGNDLFLNQKAMNRVQKPGVKF